MNAPSKDIVDMLEDSGSGVDLVYGTDLFRAFEPETPDKCVTVIDSGGYPPQSGYTYEYPTVMVRGRGAPFKYDDIYSVMDGIKNALHDLHGEVWGTSRYIGIWAQGDIIPLGYDEKNRPLLSLNFRIHRTST